MPYFVYIIFSKKINRFYIGETVDVEERLRQHNTAFFKGASTTKADDWELKIQISLTNRQEARKVERFIKDMKSRKMIERLIHDVAYQYYFKDAILQKKGIEILAIQAMD